MNSKLQTTKKMPNDTNVARVGVGTPLARESSGITGSNSQPVPTPASVVRDYAADIQIKPKGVRVLDVNLNFSGVQRYEITGNAIQLIPDIEKFTSGVPISGVYLEFNETNGNRIPVPGTFLDGSGQLINYPLAFYSGIPFNCVFIHNTISSEQYGFKIVAFSGSIVDIVRNV
jgi:hypothetical protein